jgi:thymidylate synthase ThyX
MYAAKVIADSIASGVRLTTLEVTFPRIILAEFNTHRMFSRNSASSRAIPVEKRIQAVIDNPFVPESFGSNQKGMQAGAALQGDEAALAFSTWMIARDAAITHAAILARLGVHKQLANRILEPFSWTTVVVTATEWENYFNLRISSLAQPEIRRVSELMRDAMEASTPEPMATGEWHLPYLREEDSYEVALDDDFYERSVDETLALISAARCARVSYLTHDGKRDVRADVRLALNLATNRHMSPFEHVAQVNQCLMGFGGNFRAPWWQLRKTMADESIAPVEAK